MSLAVHFAARTNVGLVRNRNEDSGYAGPHLLAVADGMGGHAGGNVASSLVVSRLAPLDGDSHGADDALELLAGKLAGANRSLAEEMKTQAELKGMGTTLTALMRCGSTGLAMVHIGDSRGYLLRDGRFTQITKDHSFVQSLVDSGRITEDEAEHHPQRSLVTRVLTGSPGDEPDLSMRQAKLGDRYLICSDGLSDYVGRDTISEVVTGGSDPDEVACRLVELALRAGAPDNVTIIVADIVRPAAGPPTQPIVVGAAAERRAGVTQPIALSPASKAAALRREATGAGAEEDVDEETDRERPWWRWLLVSMVVVLAAAGALYAAYDWSQRQLYIAPDGAYVALYSGLPQDLGPVRLHRVEQRTDIPLDDLPYLERQRVDATVGVPDLAQADVLLTGLRRSAAACRLQRSQGTACGSGMP